MHLQAFFSTTNTSGTQLMPNCSFFTVGIAIENSCSRAGRPGADKQALEGAGHSSTTL